MRQRWAIGAGVVFFILWFIWSSRKPTQPKLHEIRWEAPSNISYIVRSDLDRDGKDEVIARTENGYWWLKPSLEGWQVLQLPIKRLAYAPPLHFGVLVRDENNALCFLYYKNGWQLRKLIKMPIYELKCLDVDHDGKVNDVLVRRLQTLYWFHINDDGSVILQDARKMLPKFLLNDSALTFLSEQGKLVIMRGWCKTKRPEHDWDGDGVPEKIICCDLNCKEFVVLFSRTGKKKRLHLPDFPWDAVAVDLDGDRQKELAVILYGKWQIALIDQKGHWQVIPRKMMLGVSNLWYTKVGQKDWLWITESGNLWLLRHSEKGYQVKHWKFKGFPLAVWQDKQGVWFAFLSSLQLEWLKKILDWMRSLSIPFHIPTGKLWLHLWRWDEKQDGWQQMQGSHIPVMESPFEQELIKVDLNDDGQVEWLLLTLHFTERRLWLFVSGRLCFAERIREMDTLRDDHRKWIVTVGLKSPKALRGLTLTNP